MPQPVRSREGLATEINVLPLIDVLLVLVVAFFLMQRTRMVADIQLPPPMPAADLPGERQLVLEIRADGSFTLNGQPIPDRDLDARLATIYRDRPVKLLFVKADPARPYAEVIRAIDRAKGAGVDIIGMVPHPARP